MTSSVSIFSYFFLLPFLFVQFLLFLLSFINSFYFLLFAYPIFVYFPIQSKNILSGPITVRANIVIVKLNSSKRD